MYQLLVTLQNATSQQYEKEYKGNKYVCLISWNWSINLSVSVLIFAFPKPTFYLKGNGSKFIFLQLHFKKSTYVFISSFNYMVKSAEMVALASVRSCLHANTCIQYPKCIHIKDLYRHVVKHPFVLVCLVLINNSQDFICHFTLEHCSLLLRFFCMSSPKYCFCFTPYILFYCAKHVFSIWYKNIKAKTSIICVCKILPVFVNKNFVLNYLL